MKKTQKLEVTFTAEDMAAIELLAEEVGLSKQNWVRFQIAPHIQRIKTRAN